MRQYIASFPNDGYWGQVDMWFSRDASLLRRAAPPLRARKSHSPTSRRGGHTSGQLSITIISVLNNFGGTAKKLQRQDVES